MNKYSWNFNEHEEVWYNSCPTIEDCIEEAKWEKEDREIAELVSIVLKLGKKAR